MDEMPRAFFMLVGTIGVVSGVAMLEECSIFGYLFIAGSFVVFLAREFIK